MNTTTAAETEARIQVGKVVILATYDFPGLNKQATGYLVYRGGKLQFSVPGDPLGSKRAKEIALRIARRRTRRNEVRDYAVDLRNKPRFRWLRFIGSVPVTASYNVKTRFMEFHPNTHLAPYVP
jgi:hypothetical protein